MTLLLLLWTLPGLHPDLLRDVARGVATLTDAMWTTQAQVAGVAWRTDGRLSVAPSSAKTMDREERLWLPLAPQCRLQHEPSLWRVAVDLEAPGHVVVASPDGPEDVAGCPVLHRSMRRAIAWTWNAQAQVDASRALSESAEDLAQIVAGIERSGGHAMPGVQDSPWGYADWRFASLAPQVRKCRPLAVPCHGALPGPQDEADAWCQDPATCTADPRGMTLPQVGSLAIDPRDGTVLATTDAGLWTSPDGGRTWERTVPLRTREGLDLNAHPDLLLQLGRVQVDWQPCDPVVREKNGRRRGHLTLRMQAWWRGGGPSSQVQHGMLQVRTAPDCHAPATPNPAPLLEFRQE